MLVEIVLVAILLIAVVYFWLRLDMLERQIQHLRAQLAYHGQRSERAPIAPMPRATAAPAAPAPVSPLATRRLPARPLLRLVKNR